MPGFITHYLFGVDAYKRIADSSIKRSIRKHHSAFSLGLQGPDLFFYYVPAYFINPKNIGNVAHHNRTGEFFKALMQGRQTLCHDPEQLAAADAYICGFVGHYTLDTISHPFVYAFTGHNPAAPKSGLDYFGQHAYLETELDIELLWLRKHMSPSQFHEDSTIYLTKKESDAIAHILAYAYRTVFPEYKATEHMVKSAAKWMRTGAKLVNDPSGQKKVMVRWLEQKILKRPLISAMIPSDRYCFVEDALNEMHRTWHHPWTGEATDESFLDLYQKAGRIYDRRISSYYRLVQGGYLANDCNVFLEDYGNLSFLSGEPL